jgi:hypothetical protein
MLNFNNTTDILGMNEIFFKRIGSPSLITDGLYLYFILPLSISFIFLNFITLILLQSKKVQNTSLNKLIKIYIFTSLVICLMIFMKSLSSIPRYTSFSYSYSARIFRCQISIFGFNFLAFFSNMLSIVILLERLSMFVIRFKKFHTKHPYEYSRLMFVISFLVNLIFYFKTQTKSEEIFMYHKNNPTLLNKLEICDVTNFAETIYAKIGMVIAILFDNFFTLVIEIIASFVSIKYFRQFLKHREMLINLDHHRNKMWQFADPNQILYELSIINHNPDQANQDIGQLIYELNTSMTRFIISLTIISVFSNIISIIIAILHAIYIDSNTIYSDLDRLMLFSLAHFLFDLIYLIKHGSIFFVLVLLNRSFRKYLFNC